MSATPWPNELRVPPARDALIVTYDDGATITLGAEYLRVFTPSAERVGHGGARQVIGGKAGVRIDALTPVGRYAVRIRFDDGHDTGIYPLTSLRGLSERYEAEWAGYLAELAATRLDRQRPGVAPAPPLRRT